MRASVLSAIWRKGTTTSKAMRYGVAIAAAVLASLLRISLNPYWGDNLPYILFFPTTLFTALFAGMAPAWAGICVMAAMTAIWVLAPAGVALVDQPVQIIGLIVYVAMDGMVAWFGGKHRDVLRISEAQRAELELERNTRKAVQDRIGSTLETVRHRAEQFETLVKAAPLGIYLVDADFRFVQVNPIALPVFGDSPGGVIGRDFVEVMHALWEKKFADEVVDIFRHTLETGESYVCTERAEYRIDRERTEYYEWRLDRILLPDGRYGLVCYFRDISAQAEARIQREALLESERVARAEADKAVRLKDEFLAILSHELRSPLNAITGWTHLLKLGASDPVKVLQSAEVIERNAKAQTQLISDLLDMSRVASAKLRLEVKRLDMSAIVAAAVQSIRPVAETKGVRIETSLAPIDGAVDGDAGRIAQVLGNLLSNAVKFTPKDGLVQVLMRQADEVLELAVQDTGEGIEPEFIPFVFDRFRQADATTARRYGGLGLGLALVKQLTELHGGTVEARSEGKGRGATFIVRLPLGAASIEGVAKERLEPLDHIDLSGVSVLVVDDDIDTVEMLRRLLEECRAEVMTALSADEALAHMDVRKVDVLVSDIGMPLRDGYELIKEVRSRKLQTPAVALTAFARAEDREKAFRAGYQVYLRKPVDTSKLIATVNALAGRVIRVAEIGSSASHGGPATGER